MKKFLNSTAASVNRCAQHRAVEDRRDPQQFAMTRTVSVLTQQRQALERAVRAGRICLSCDARTDSQGRLPCGH